MDLHSRRNKIIKQFLNVFLMVIVTLGAVLTVNIDVKAVNKENYSIYSWYDGYNMTYDEIVNWALSRSNGKTEKQNKNTSAEFTNCYVEKTEDKNSVTLTLWIKDKDNSGAATIIRIAEAAENATANIESSYDAAFTELLGNGILKDLAKETKLAKEIGEYATAIMQVDAVIKAYTANRIKFTYKFLKDSKGKINKPYLIMATSLYENHEKDYKHNEVGYVNSVAYAIKNKPVKYKYQAQKVYDGGLWYWLVVIEPRNYT